MSSPLLMPRVAVSGIYTSKDVKTSNAANTAMYDSGYCYANVLSSCDRNAYMEIWLERIALCMSRRKYAGILRVVS